MTASSNEDCFQDNRKYSGGTTYKYVADFQECIALCGSIDNCEAISYQASSKSCIGHTSRSATTAASGYTAFSLLCPGGLPLHSSKISAILFQIDGVWISL